MNDRPLSAFQLTLYALGYVLLLAGLFYVNYHPPEGGGDALMTWLYTALGTLSGHILGATGTKARAARESAKAQSTGHATTAPAGTSAPVLASPSLPAQPSAQTGRVSLSVLLLIPVIVCACLQLAGCSGLNVSWVATASYNTPATTNAIMTPGAEKPEQRP